MFVIVQITAAAGSFAFGLIQGRIGSRVTYMLTLGLWFFAVLGIWGVGGLTSWLNSTFQTTFEAQYVFLFIGLLSGLSLGSSQSASRALVGLFTPEEKSPNSSASGACPINWQVSLVLWDWASCRHNSVYIVPCCFVLFSS